ncbi:DUF4167 domain-containing protein [Rhodalgimonas zhirmunskyi]|uniref:DUF4167 domain-containing protein n=1 Tax=Rhodalgimonas zhirmunskyi TaxID=2964767 RepID=A0AAJ1U561_9RHOB|nr:DUF4167 domain-containing protein [Rhodoalgimonas zhirmunskyi]MDQ2093224.1 DUF4167 domain-containing protein [Rhodoalgimonas zhirmunskyi]
MRSSKSRSRSKNNRNRSSSGGNIVNRVFDSSGPEGKVRGTPQQIIDKYNQLARDAQLAGDRVAAENFQQHAEHYLRMLGEAQREMDAKREQQEQQNRDRQAERDRERAKRQEREMSGGQVTDDPSSAPQPDVIDATDEGGDSGLVETPESQSLAESKTPPKSDEKPKRTRRKPRKAAPDAAADAAPGEDKSEHQDSPKEADAAE